MVLFYRKILRWCAVKHPIYLSIFLSISAQSNFAVGAVLNATFGSVVEISLYIMALAEGAKKETTCYVELVKSSLVGM